MIANDVSWYNDPIQSYSAAFETAKRAVSSFFVLFFILTNYIKAVKDVLKDEENQGQK